MENSHETEIVREQKLVNRVYAAAVAMVIFSCIPSLPLQVAAFFLLLYVMSASYSLRAKYPQESLVWNHMVFLIRTFWISTLFFAIGFAVAAAYLSQRLAFNALSTMSENFVTTGQISWNDQLRQMTVVSLVTMGPSIIYFIYRVAKGLHRALKGHRIGNIKAWF
jgi:uncharacterized membrane protein